MNLFGKYDFVLAAILFCVATVNGQNLHFRHFEFHEQYPDMKYNCLYEDQQHLIWIGTTDGLFSFDGQRFREYSIERGAGTENVTAMYQDPEGIFWVGLENGWIGQLQYDSVRSWQIEEGHPKVRIVDFCNTQDGTFWIATYGEGVFFHYENILYNVNLDDGLDSDDVYSMINYENEAWIGTDDGMHRISHAKGEKYVQHFGRDENIPDEIVKSLDNKDSTIWAGSFSKGIFTVNTTDQIVILKSQVWTHGEIQAISLYNDTELWIGAENTGLFRYTISDETLQHIELPLTKPVHIMDILVDEEGNLWILDRHDGIFLTNRHFEFIKSPVENLQTVLADPEYGIIVGNADGVFSIDPIRSTAQALPMLQDINVLSLWIDPLKRLWIGTFGQGLYVYDYHSQKTKAYHKSDGLTNESILSISGKGNTMWLATLGGVTEITLPVNLSTDYLETRNYNLEDGLGTNYIYTCYVDRKDRVWFGTDGKGLSVLHNQEITNYTQADTVPLESVYSITEDASGNIWFSTDQAGVFKFDGKNFTHFNDETGLRHLEINSLIADQRGNILLSHPDGIDLINSHNSTVLYFGSESGLEECNPNLNAVYRHTDGTVWIACASELVKFMPFGKFRFTPRTVMLDVSVFLEPVAWRDNIIYQANQNYLSFHYAGLWYSDPRSVTYRYILEGLDPGWKTTKEQRVTYHRLPPGDYTFRLQSGFGVAITGESEFRYDFSIKKPWYNTNAFFVGLALIVALIAYGFIRIRDRRIEQTAHIKRQQVEHQLQTLQSQINPHFLFNSFNTLVSIIEDDPEIAVEYVENLSDFFRNILQYRTKSLIPLEEELNIANNFAYLLKKRFRDNLKFENTIEDGDYEIPPLTLQILLENAVKHNIISKQKPLYVKLYNEGEDYLIISNNLQRKTTPERSTHYGLQSIVNRFRYLTDRPVIIEDNHQMFTVKIPLIKNSKS